VNVYKVMVGRSYPAIAFVSTISPEGVLNLAPFSFFTEPAPTAGGLLLPMHNAEGIRKTLSTTSSAEANSW